MTLFLRGRRKVNWSANTLYFGKPCNDDSYRFDVHNLTHVPVFHGIIQYTDDAQLFIDPRGQNLPIDHKGRFPHQLMVALQQESGVFRSRENGFEGLWSFAKAGSSASLTLIAVTSKVKWQEEEPRRYHLPHWFRDNGFEQ
jgi:hypothetical protein